MNNLNLLLFLTRFTFLMLDIPYQVEFSYATITIY